MNKWRLQLSASLVVGLAHGLLRRILWLEGELWLGLGISLELRLYLRRRSRFKLLLIQFLKLKPRHHWKWIRLNLMPILKINLWLRRLLWITMPQRLRLWIYLF